MLQDIQSGIMHWYPNWLLQNASINSFCMHVYRNILPTGKKEEKNNTHTHTRTHTGTYFEVDCLECVALRM